MSETSLSALLPSVRLLLLGYGHVAQALLPLLASRSEWLGNELGVRPVISGVGTRSRGFHIHPRGIEPSLLALDSDPLQKFTRASTRVDNAHRTYVAQSTKWTTSSQIYPQCTSGRISSNYRKQGAGGLCPIGIAGAGTPSPHAISLRIDCNGWISAHQPRSIHSTRGWYPLFSRPVKHHE